MRLGAGTSKVVGARELTCTEKDVSMATLRAATTTGTITLNQTLEYLPKLILSRGREEQRENLEN